MLLAGRPVCDDPTELDPIELDDPLEAFRDFSAMLLTYDLIPYLDRRFLT